jgi:glycosyltransferase involved in cell wall biosynthesis
LDFDLFNKKTDISCREYPLAGLFNSRRRQTKRPEDIQLAADKSNVKCLMLNKDIKNANPIHLNNWYNNIKVWMAPTELEGLHNPPMEASLSGCGLVCTNHERSGMTDYAIHNETALVYNARDIDMASEYINMLLNDDVLLNRLNNNMIEYLREKIGSREDSAKKFIKALYS